MKALRLLIIAAAVCGVGYLAFAACQTVFYSGAETGDLSDWTGLTQSNGATIAVSAHGEHHGDYCFRAAPANGNAESRIRVGWSPGAAYRMDGWFNTDSLTISAQSHIFSVFSTEAGTGAINRIQFNLVPVGASDYAIRCVIRDDTRTIVSTSVNLDTIPAVAGWHMVTCAATQVAGPNGVLRIYVDGQAVFSADTLDMDSIRVDSLGIGISTPPTSINSGAVLWDDIAIDSELCFVPCGGFRRP